ncbi:MAG TPA: ribokinase [Planktothrix sp.]|jgi:ribokinase
MRKRVVVIGSLSQDLVVKAPRLPARGETIRGTDFGMFVGGKGNNQALAAARAGASVAMVGRVGHDQFGNTIIDTLVKSGVDASHVHRDEKAGSGIAIILVGGDGDNSIVIAQQANLELSERDVEQAKPLLQSAAIVLLQMEVRTETVIAAAKAAKHAGVPVALNPAPAPEDGKLPPELWHSLDIIIPNQTEAALLLGVESVDLANAERSAAALQAMGPKTVILTLGEQGALLVDGNAKPVHVQSFSVTAIDTTAAGDAFCGAFAAALSSGSSLEHSVRFGCAAGALACTRLGAEPSLPQRQEIERLAGTVVK